MKLPLSLCIQQVAGDVFGFSGDGYYRQAGREINWEEK